MDLHAVKLQAVDWATTYSIFNFRLFGPKVTEAQKKVRPARPWSYLDFSKYNTVAAVAVLRSVMVVLPYSMVRSSAVTPLGDST